MDGSELNGHAVTEAELLAEGYRKYAGDDVDIYYSKDICAHIANCVRGNPALFDVSRRPWIMTDNASGEEAIRVINMCPSGALKYIRKGE